MNLSEVLEESEDFRLDSEFLLKTTSKFDFVKGKEIIDFIQYGTSKALNEEQKGYPVLRLNEFDSYFIKKPKKYCDLLSEKEFYNLTLKKGDVLICRTNGNPFYVGKSAVVMEDFNYAFASYLYRVRPKTNIINSSTLMIYLNSSYGRKEIEKYSMVSNQANFSPAKFKNIKIPLFPHSFQQKIEKMVKEAYDKLKESKKLYKEAENLLLEELGLKDFKPSEENIAIKKLEDSFLATGRLDAEYYQPKYEEIIDKIKSYEGGWKTLRDIVIDYSTGYPFKSSSFTDEGIYLIRINNIAKGELDLSNAVKIPFKDKNLSPKDIVKENDILISMSGTIGISCKIPKNIEAVVNQRILKISIKNFSFDVLPLIINSIIGKYQIERVGTGGVQTNISANDILDIIIPDLNNSTQIQQIENLIKTSFKLKEESKNLLDLAIKAVEIAIEKDENEAINYITKVLYYAKL